MKRIRVIQIGIGHDHAHSSFVTMKNQREHFDVVALAFPSEEEKFLKKYKEFLGETRVMGVEEALSLPDIDAAVIETDDAWKQLSVSYRKRKPRELRNLHMEHLCRLQLK